MTEETGSSSVHGGKEVRGGQGRRMVPISGTVTESEEGQRKIPIRVLGR